MTYTIMTLNGNTEIFGETPEILKKLLAPVKIAQDEDYYRLVGRDGEINKIFLIAGVEYALVSYMDDKNNTQVRTRTSGNTYYTDGTFLDGYGKIQKPYYKEFGGIHDWRNSTDSEIGELPCVSQNNSREGILGRLSKSIPDLRLALREIF